ncbi:MAG: carbamate kinase [Candidatus Eremiobacteraeota bacterium]|nr:carbamate kinase [Candidatus Eremiobacteraeota bacterium]
MQFCLARSEAEMEANFALREEVFVHEQGVPLELEKDELDELAEHLVLFSGNQPIATARLVEIGDGRGKIGRVVVRRSARGTGVGQTVMRVIEERARQRGMVEVMLDAQLDVIPFYEMLGYRAEGPEFDDAGIIHRRMFRRLPGLAVVAVGGNAVVDGYASIQASVIPIVGLLERGWKVVLTHGNGPQVGASLRRSELARDQVAPLTLDQCVAETQATLGYDFQRALGAEFRARGMQTVAVSLVTQVEVDPQDPAFENPEKPIGPFLLRDAAEARRDEEGWTIVEDAGRGWRRVVPSPEPRRIVELPAMRALAQQDVMMVVAGGGGIPVNDRHEGLPAVIDKDRTAGLLAAQMAADLLLICTAVPKVYIHFGTSQEQALDTITSEQAQTYMQAGHFGAGSMLPKVEAAARFAQRTGARAAITDSTHLVAAAAGREGTQFTRFAFRG